MRSREATIVPRYNEASGSGKENGSDLQGVGAAQLPRHLRKSSSGLRHNAQKRFVPQRTKLPTTYRTKVQLFESKNNLYYSATFYGEWFWGRPMSQTIPTRIGFKTGSAPDIQNVKPVSPNRQIRVAIIEDDERVRQALVFQLTTAGFKIAAYTTAEGLLEAVDAKEFDCVVADIYLPRMNGLQLQQELTRTVPHASIVFITGHGDLSLGMHAMRKGAVDFLEKPVDDQALLSSIIRGADLSRKRRTEQSQRTELEDLQHSLTSREREVFALITTGLLNKQVAFELGTTERTVKAHRASVMNKMGAGSLADLVRMAGTLQIHSD
jgi:FixJ family two-component response regulator